MIAALKHPVSCASMSRPVGKSGKRRELWTSPMPMLCDCPIGEEQRKKEKRLREAAPALADALEKRVRDNLDNGGRETDSAWMAEACAALRAAGRLP